MPSKALTYAGWALLVGTVGGLGVCYPLFLDDVVTLHRELGGVLLCQERLEPMRVR